MGEPSWGRARRRSTSAARAVDLRAVLPIPAAAPATAARSSAFSLQESLSTKKPPGSVVPEPGQNAMDQPSDGALLAAVRSGEPSALNELVLRHQGVLLRHARALLGEGGPFEDAVQETFLRLLERPPVLDDGVL